MTNTERLNSLMDTEGKLYYLVSVSFFQRKRWPFERYLHNVNSPIKQSLWNFFARNIEAACIRKDHETTLVTAVMLEFSNAFSRLCFVFLSQWQYHPAETGKGNRKCGLYVGEAKENFWGPHPFLLCTHVLLPQHPFCLQVIPCFSWKLKS